MLSPRRTHTFRSGRVGPPSRGSRPPPSRPEDPLRRPTARLTHQPSRLGLTHRRRTRCYTATADEPIANKLKSARPVAGAADVRCSTWDPDPATRSRTVEETRTSPGCARAAMLALISAAGPPVLPSTTTHSPVCSPARTSSPRSAPRSTTARAQRMARAGPSNLALVLGRRRADRFSAEAGKLVAD